MGRVFVMEWACLQMWGEGGEGLEGEGMPTDVGRRAVGLEGRGYAYRFHSQISAAMTSAG